MPLRLRPIDDNQDAAELTDFVALAVELDVRRYLEIGSRNGNSFYAVMANLRPGAFGMAIDLPENAGTRARLNETAREIEVLGSRTKIIFASSHWETSVRTAAAGGPFDLILIDGNHRYEGVRSDWESYAHFGRVVALHDVAAPDGHISDGAPNGVGKFWRELKGKPFRVVHEIVTPGSCMGFGIVAR